MALYRWVYNPDTSLNGTVVDLDEAQARDLVRENRLARLTPEEETAHRPAPVVHPPAPKVEPEPEPEDLVGPSRRRRV
jgi:hypothetical protein